MESGDKCIIRTEQIKPNRHKFQNKKEEKNMVLKDWQIERGVSVWYQFVKSKRYLNWKIACRPPLILTILIRFKINKAEFLFWYLFYIRMVILGYKCPAGDNNRGTPLSLIFQK